MAEITEIKEQARKIIESVLDATQNHAPNVSMVDNAVSLIDKIIEQAVKETRIAAIREVIERLEGASVKP